MVRNPEKSQKQMAAEAEAAIKGAIKVRRRWRWKKPSPRRTAELKEAFDRLTVAIDPIRQLNGKAVYKRRFENEKLKRLSLEIQVQKIKLQKMLPSGTLSTYGNRRREPEECI